MALRPTGRAIAETLGRGIIHATFAWQTPLGGPCAANVGYAAGRVYTEITRVTARQSRDLLLISGRVARQHSRAWNYPRDIRMANPAWRALRRQRRLCRRAGIHGNHSRNGAAKPRPAPDFRSCCTATLSGVELSTPFFARSAVDMALIGKNFSCPALHAATPPTDPQSLR